MKTVIKKKIEEKNWRKSVVANSALHSAVLATFYRHFYVNFAYAFRRINGVVAKLCHGGNGTDAKNISPSSGIPSIFRQDVANASSMYAVPMQYLAGETAVESGWNPNANANQNDSNSHAMGLMQFEPETWSGWSNPNGSVSSPDTDQTRIAKYRGYGEDANSYWAPVGTGATAAPQDAYMNQMCKMNNYAGCAPYSSPLDPADALAGGAHYLSSLYHVNADWAAASAQYYGGSDAEKYVQNVMSVTDAYIADTSPIVRTSTSKNKTKTKTYFDTGIK